MSSPRQPAPATITTLPPSRLGPPFASAIGDPRNLPCVLRRRDLAAYQSFLGLAEVLGEEVGQLVYGRADVLCSYPKDR